MPQHTDSNPSMGKTCPVELPHQRVDFAHLGNAVRFNIKALDKDKDGTFYHCWMDDGFSLSKAHQRCQSPDG